MYEHVTYTCWGYSRICLVQTFTVHDIRLIVLYLRNRKHFARFHTAVIKTRVELWENEKLQCEHESIARVDSWECWLFHFVGTGAQEVGWVTISLQY